MYSTTYMMSQDGVDEIGRRLRAFWQKGGGRGNGRLTGLSMPKSKQRSASETTGPIGIGTGRCVGFLLLSARHSETHQASKGEG